MAGRSPSCARRGRQSRRPLRCIGPRIRKRVKELWMSIKQSYIDGMKRAFAATPFAEWLAEEGTAVYEGFSVEDVRELELKPWPRIGGNACFINLYAFMEAGNGVYVAEIPPGGKLE